MNEFMYILFVVLADILAARWIVPLFFGLAVPAGVFAIAPIFTIRDEIHRKRGRRGAYVLIGVASLISFLISVVTENELLGRVTIASVIAFVGGEVVDTEIYHKVCQRSRYQAIIVSNLFSAAIDSILFIWIAFGLDWRFVLGQYLVKIAMSLAWAFCIWVRQERK